MGQTTVQRVAMNGGRLAFVASLTAALALFSGCEEGVGGAVELSWNLRTANGDDTNCDATRVRRMRLSWDVAGQTGSQEWRCNDVRAITGFDLPPGPALLWLTPVCSRGPADPASFVTPPPVARTIVAGESVTLGAVVVQVQVGNCDAQACICP